MTYQDAARIINQELKKSSYNYEEIKSKTTNSLYYKIYSSSESLIFRVSDHNSKKNILTYRIDKHKNNNNNLKKFVQNRVKDLQVRTVKSLLGV